MSLRPSHTAHPRRPVVGSILLLGATSQPAWSAQPAAQSTHLFGSINPFAFILLELGLVIIVALAAHIISQRCRLPLVLGELVIGMAAGNLLYWLKWSPLFYLLMHIGDAGELFKIVWSSNLSVAEAAALLDRQPRLDGLHAGSELVRDLSQGESPELVLMGIALWLFSNIGVVLVLFKLGLETRVKDLLAAKPMAYFVSLTGAVAPFLLGLVITSWLLTNQPATVHIFVAAALCTTSAGISAQLFAAIGRQASPEARLALDAAFIDDVIAVFLLAIITSIALGNKTAFSEIAALAFSALLFFAAIVVFTTRRFRQAPLLDRMHEPHIRLLIPVAIVFVTSWLSNLAGLGVIAGAFTAGMILNGQPESKAMIENLITPLEKIFAPIFFVFVGMQVNLSLFLQPDIVWLTLMLAIAALAGKAVAGFVAQRPLDRRIIGLGLMPRGEAVLIFVSVGKVLGAVNDTLFSVIVMMVVITNVVAPVALKRLLHTGH